MADNNLRVRIVASDEASAVLDKFQKRLGTTEAPAKRLAKATGQVSKSTKGWRQLGQSGSFDEIGKGLKSIGSQAHSAFRDVGRLSAGLGSLSNIGEIGMGAMGLGGAAGIGAALIGVAALTKAWADHGEALSNSGMSMDMGAGELYRYQRAAALTGVSADSVTSSLGGLYGAIRSSKTNTAVANALRVIGVNAQDAHGKLLPVTQLMPKIFDGIDKLPNAYAQINAMQALGMSPDMLPFVRQGGAALKKEMNQLQSQGIGDNFGGSKKLYADWQTLDTAITNTADIFAKNLAPAADSVVQSLTGFFNWLPHLDDKPDPTVIDTTDAWIPRPGGRGGMMPNPNYSPPMDQGAGAWVPRNGGHGGRGGLVFDPLTDAQIRAQEQQESGGRQINSDGTPVASKKGAVGIMQLLPSTAQQVAKEYNIPFDLHKLQYDADYNQKLGVDYMQDMMTKFKGNRDEALAAYNDGPTAVQNAIDRYGPNWRSSMPKETQDYVANIDKSTDSPGGNSAVTVNVNHNNAPPGTTISATTAGNNVNLGQVRVNLAMAGAGT